MFRTLPTAVRRSKTEFPPHTQTGNESLRIHEILIISCLTTPRSVERLEEEKEIPIFEKSLLKGIKVIEFDIKTTNNEENKACNQVTKMTQPVETSQIKDIRTYRLITPASYISFSFDFSLVFDLFLFTTFHSHKRLPTFLNSTPHSLYSSLSLSLSLS